MSTMRARVAFFAVRADGSEAFVGIGQEVEDSHELVQGREDFEPTNDAPMPTKRAATKRAPKAKA